MTKKSFKRSQMAQATSAIVNQNAVARRAEQTVNTPNNSWDEVNQLSSLCAQLLLQATGLRPALDNKELMSYVENPDALYKSAHILSRELITYGNELMQLRALHKDRSGNASNQDENMEAIDIYTKYAMFAERFEANITPIVMHMVEIINVAETKLREVDNDAADAIDNQVSQELQTVKAMTGQQSNQTVESLKHV